MAAHGRYRAAARHPGPPAAFRRTGGTGGAQRRPVDGDRRHPGHSPPPPRRRPGGDPPALRDRPARRRRRPGLRPRGQLPGRPADPLPLRLHHPERLSPAQPDRGGSAQPGGGRRLRPRRAGAVLGHRSPVPAALQADALWRAGRRVHALPALGSRPQGRACGAQHRRMRPPGQDRPHHPHQPAGGTLSLGRPGALRPVQEAVQARDRQAWRRGLLP